MRNLLGLLAKAPVAKHELDSKVPKHRCCAQLGQVIDIILWSNLGPDSKIVSSRTF